VCRVTAAAIASLNGLAASQQTFGTLEIPPCESTTARIGMTPHQRSSGGEERLDRFTTTGGKYLCQLLVAGAAALVRSARRKPEPVDPRLVALLARKPARIASAIMARGSVFARGHAPMLAA